MGGIQAAQRFGTGYAQCSAAADTGGHEAYRDGHDGGCGEVVVVDNERAARWLSDAPDTGSPCSNTTRVGGRPVSVKSVTDPSSGSKQDFLCQRVRVRVRVRERKRKKIGRTVRHSRSEDAAAGRRPLGGWLGTSIASCIRVLDTGGATTACGPCPFPRPWMCSPSGANMPSDPTASCNGAVCVVLPIRRYTDGRTDGWLG